MKLEGELIVKEILIVEDERVLRDALRHSLEAAGYAVRVARDGVQGVAEWERKRPDLIIMNGEMPHKNGLQATAEIRERDSQTPIILLSAWCGVPDKIESIKRQMPGAYADFVDPNTSEDALLAIIRDLVSDEGTKAGIA